MRLVRTAKARRHTQCFRASEQKKNDGRAFSGRPIFSECVPASAKHRPWVALRLLHLHTAPVRHGHVASRKSAAGRLCQQSAISPEATPTSSCGEVLAGL